MPKALARGDHERGILPSSRWWGFGGLRGEFLKCTCVFVRSGLFLELCSGVSKGQQSRFSMMPIVGGVSGDLPRENLKCRCVWSVFVRSEAIVELCSRVSKSQQFRFSMVPLVDWGWWEKFGIWMKFHAIWGYSWVSKSQQFRFFNGPSRWWGFGGLLSRNFWNLYAFSCDLRLFWSSVADFHRVSNIVIFYGRRPGAPPLNPLVFSVTFWHRALQWIRLNITYFPYRLNNVT